MSVSDTQKYKFLFAVSGSIAAYKSCELISSLVKQGHEVQVVTSKSAHEFVGKTTFEGLSGRKVYDSLFEAGQAMQHIDLARWCDAFVLYPASANTLNRLAAGLCDDTIGSLFLALETSVPKFIAPAMNQQMIQHPSVQSSVEKLQSWGVTLLPAAEGALACGEVGGGRLIEPEKAEEILLEHLKCPDRPERTKPKSFKKGQLDLTDVKSSIVSGAGFQSKKILITSGGTREPIDGVRFLTNMSTGRTAAKLADDLIQAGHSVIYLHSQDAIQPNMPPYKKVPYTSFNVLNQTLKSILNLEEIDIIVHAAAVSDYSIDMIEYKSADGELSTAGPSIDHKIKTAEDMNLKLRPNFKIVDRIKSYSRNKDVKVIAFKLTHTDKKELQLEQVQTLFDNSQADAIVHNDFSQLKTTKRFQFFDKSQELQFSEEPIDIGALGQRIFDFSGDQNEQGTLL